MSIILIIIIIIIIILGQHISIKIGHFHGTKITSCIIHNCII